MSYTQHNTNTRDLAMPAAILSFDALFKDTTNTGISLFFHVLLSLLGVHLDVDLLQPA